MNWMVRTASETETNIVAVERLEEYAGVKQEVCIFFYSQFQQKLLEQIN